MKTFDVAIVGAGIVGCACASVLAAENLRVALIESDVIGSGATAAGMGHIAVMDDSEAQFALCRYSQSLWQELAESLPASCEYVQAGAMWVAADEVEMAEVHRKFSFYQSRGVPAEILDAKSLQQAEPNLRAGLAGGLLLRQDAILYPPAAAFALFEMARRKNCVLFLGHRVASINTGFLTLSNGDNLRSDLIILANGSSIHTFLPDTPMRPRKGHLIITDRYPAFLRHQLIELGYLKNAHASNSDSVAFNAQPRATGQLLIGSSRQYGVTDSAIDRTILDRMLRRATYYMPAVEKLSVIRSWTGFRASTPDNLPLIGLCPGAKNIYLAAGHEGLGITTSLGTAHLIADLILQRPSDIPLEAYSPQRAYGAH